MSDLSDVVTEYTEALYQGEDLMPALLAKYEGQWTELPAFLELSRALQKTLMPMQPTIAFKQQLKAQLLSDQPLCTAKENDCSPQGNHCSLSSNGCTAKKTTALYQKMISWVGKRLCKTRK